MPPAGSPGRPHLRPARHRNRLWGTETAPLSPRRLPASRGAPGSRVPAAARGPELLWGRDPRPRPALGPLCSSPAPRARIPCAAGREVAPAREMRPLAASSDGDTGPPRLLAPPAAPSAARGGHQARRLGRLPVERRGGPKTTTWGQLHARRFFDPCLWCERTQISHPGRKKGSL